MSLAGLPLHPLLVHLAVVSGPLASLLAICFVLLPRQRWRLRWPLALVLGVAVLAGVGAAMSGAALLEQRAELLELGEVTEHGEAGELTRNAITLLGVLGGAAIWLLPGYSPMRPEDPPRADGLRERVIGGFTIVAAVAVLGCTIWAGHSGSAAVWG